MKHICGTCKHFERKFSLYRLGEKVNSCNKKESPYSIGYFRKKDSCDYWEAK